MKKDKLRQRIANQRAAIEHLDRELETAVSKLHAVEQENMRHRTALDMASRERDMLMLRLNEIDALHARLDEIEVLAKAMSKLCSSVLDL